MHKYILYIDGAIFFVPINLPIKKKGLMMCSIIAASEYDTIGVAFITFIVDGKNRYNEQNNVRRKLQKDI